VRRKHYILHQGIHEAVKISERGFLGGNRPVLMAWVRLGLFIPVLIFAGSTALLGVLNTSFPEYQPQALIMLILLGFGYWLYASLAIFHCALKEKRNTWLAGALLFLVPFQAVAVIRALLGNIQAILGLVGA
jgi:hypothetical protein